MRSRLITFVALFGAATLSPSPAAAEVRVATVEKPEVSLDLYGWSNPGVDAVFPGREQTDLSFRAGLRLGAIGRLGKWAKLRTEIEVHTSGLNAYLAPLDLYGIVTPYRSRRFGVDLTLGRFRVPFSRQALLQPVGLQLPSLGLSAEISPGRQVGATAGVDFLDRKIRLSAGTFNGGWPAMTAVTGNVPGTGPGGPFNTEYTKRPWLLHAARVEVHPFGQAPEFEGDVRPLERRGRFLASIGASALSTSVRQEIRQGGLTRLERDTSFRAIEGDLALFYAGASLYAEVQYRVFDSDQPGTATSIPVYGYSRYLTTNVQLGYFLPLPFVEEHLELALRVALQGDGYTTDPSDPAVGTPMNLNELGLGINFFFDRGHLLKIQAYGNIYNYGQDKSVTLQGMIGF